MLAVLTAFLLSVSGLQRLSGVLVPEGAVFGRSGPAVIYRGKDKWLLSSGGRRGSGTSLCRSFRYYPPPFYSERGKAGDSFPGRSIRR